MSRINISLSDELQERASKIIKSRGFRGLSDLLGTLVREEYERRIDPASITAANPALNERGRYKIKRKT